LKFGSVKDQKRSRLNVRVALEELHSGAVSRLREFCGWGG
jgi:hypothetical protein